MRLSQSLYLNANSDDDGGTDFRPQLRIRRERSGSTTVNLGHLRQAGTSGATLTT